MLIRQHAYSDPGCLFLLLDAVPEPELLLLVVEHHLGVHARDETELVATLLTFAPRLGRHLASAVVLAREARVLGALVGAAEEGATAGMIKNICRSSSTSLIKNIKGLIHRRQHNRIVSYVPVAAYASIMRRVSPVGRYPAHGAVGQLYLFRRGIVRAVMDSGGVSGSGDSGGGFGGGGGGSASVLYLIGDPKVNAAVHLGATVGRTHLCCQLSGKGKKP
jgi:hypothetical protein